MTISNKATKNDSGRNAGAQGRDSGAKPGFGVFRTLYKWWKYATILGVVLAIVLVGVVVLGDVSEEIREEKRLTALYKGSAVFSKATDDIHKLLNTKKSSFISNKVLNLYLSEKINKNDNLQDFDHKFADLEHFAYYFLTQRYNSENFVRFPLSMYEKNFIQVVDEPVTSKGLRWLKTKVQAFLDKNGLTQDKNVKDLKWSRVKKLVDSAKFGQIIELVKNNAINWTWQWIGNPAKVTILIMDQSNISKSNPTIIQKNKKLLKKWVQQNQDKTEIFILSRYSINSQYNEDKSDTFKSYQVETGLEKFDKMSFCKYLNEQAKLNEVECNLMRSNFDSFDDLDGFVQKNYQNEPVMFKQSQNKEQLERVLQKVCEKGHLKYYFYQSQQNVNKVLQKNKKAKKSRLDRQMDALLVKFSELKNYLGINRIRDVFSTLTVGSKGEDNDRLGLSEVNSVGLLYDFQNHELRWRNEYERIGYEIRAQRGCKGEKFVEEEIKEQEKQKRKEKEERQQEQEQMNEDEQVDEEEIEEEYEESPVDYRQGGLQEEGQDEEGGQQLEQQQLAEQELEADQATEQQEQATEQQEQATEQQEQATEQQEQVTEQQADGQEAGQQDEGGAQEQQYNVAEQQQEEYEESTEEDEEQSYQQAQDNEEQQEEEQEQKEQEEQEEQQEEGVEQQEEAQVGEETTESEQQEDSNQENNKENQSNQQDQEEQQQQQANDQENNTDDEQQQSQQEDNTETQQQQEEAQKAQEKALGDSQQQDSNESQSEQQQPTQQQEQTTADQHQQKTQTAQQDEEQSQHQQQSSIQNDNHNTQQLSNDQNPESQPTQNQPAQTDTRNRIDPTNTDTSTTDQQKNDQTYSQTEKAQTLPQAQALQSN